MQTVNIHEAKTHLSKLLEQVVNGEPFIIATAGVPMVKVVALSAMKPSRLILLCSGADNATTLTIGTPALAIINGSPLTTCSRSLDR